MAGLIPFRLDTVGLAEVVEQIVHWCHAPSGRARIVVTPNINYLARAFREPTFAGLLRSADLSVCDGAGLQRVSALAGQRLPGRVPGVDLVAALCARFSETKHSVLFVGATPALIQRTARTVWPTGVHPRFAWVCVSPHMLHAARTPAVLARYQCAVAILGLGRDSVEMAHRWRDAGVGKVLICVGGALDILGGRTPRAPQWIRGLGLEGLWRIWQEPQRLGPRCARDVAIVAYEVMQWAMRQKSQGSSV